MANYNPGNKDNGNNSRAADILQDLEKTGEVIKKELLEQYERVRKKASSLAHTVAEGTVAVKDRVTSDETRERLSELVDDVEETGEHLLNQFNERMTDLRQRVANAIESLKTPTTVSGKKTVRKKSAGKKKTARKKAAKKKATKKKPSSKKKAAKKKTMSRKTAEKKTVSKKSSRSRSR